MEQHARDNNFFSTVLWTDESTFSRDRINNFHNDHIWSLNNPHAFRSRRFQQRFNINIWGGLFNNTLLRLHVFNGTLNAEMYYDFLDNTLINFLEDIPLNLRQNMWHQQDGTPPHRARLVKQWLNTHFQNRWIGIGGAMTWPPRSPDLNPCDFYLWGHLKQLVYAVNIIDHNQLMHRIQEAATNIRTNINSLRVQQSMIRRCEACIEAEGHSFEHLM